MDTCLVTGARGYLGSRVKAALEKRGWRVVEMARNPKLGSTAIQFHLGADVPASALAGAKAIVHCAYDSTPTSPTELRQLNLDGTAKILRAARDAGVQNLVHISSLSAFDECRSQYGKTKLAVEKAVEPLGAIIIRPGMVWGEKPEAMLSRLISEVDRAKILPLVGGSQVQYMVHDEDLCDFICRCAAGEVAVRGVPITIAHEQPWTLRKMLEEIARAKEKKITLVPLPWQPIWLAFKLAELCGVRMKFKSDSLIGLVYQNTNPSFALQHELKITCRPFHFELPRS